MSADVLATFDSSKTYAVRLKDTTATLYARIHAARTDETGRIIALLGKTNDGMEDVVINWDNVLYVSVF